MKARESDLKKIVDEKVDLFIRDLTVIVNAAGKGVRLRPATIETPKPLVRVGQKREPLMYWAMLPLLSGGASRFVIGIRHRGDLIRQEFENGEKLSRRFNREIKIDYVEEPRPLGRAGCVQYALEIGKVDPGKPSIIMNASDVLKLDLRDLVRNYLWKRSNYGFHVLQVYASGYRVQYGVGKLHPSTGGVIGFEEKPFREEPTNTACYCMRERLEDFRKIRRIPSDPEDELVGRWLREGVLGSYVISKENVVSVKFEKDLQRVLNMDFEKFLLSHDAGLGKARSASVSRSRD